MWNASILARLSVAASGIKDRDTVPPQVCVDVGLAGRAMLILAPPSHREHTIGINVSGFSGLPQCQDVESSQSPGAEDKLITKYCCSM